MSHTAPPVASARPLAVMLAGVLAAALAACASNASSDPGNGAASDESAPNESGANESGANASTSTSESAMRTIAAGTPASLHLGETVRLPDGATLKFVSVPQDSRCPPNAQCIRAGDADLLFDFATGGALATHVTPNLPEAPAKDMGAWRLTVTALEFDSAPDVTLRIDPAQ